MRAVTLSKHIATLASHSLYISFFSAHFPPAHLWSLYAEKTMALSAFAALYHQKNNRTSENGATLAITIKSTRRIVRDLPVSLLFVYTHGSVFLFMAIQIIINYQTNTKKNRYGGDDFVLFVLTAHEYISFPHSANTIFAHFLYFLMWDCLYFSFIYAPLRATTARPPQRHNKQKINATFLYLYVCVQFMRHYVNPHVLRSRKIYGINLSHIVTTRRIYAISGNTFSTYILVHSGADKPCIFKT